MLSLEELGESIEEIKKTANETMKTMNELKTRDHPLHQAQNDDHDDPKNKEGKKAKANDDDDYTSTNNDDDNHKAQNDEEKKEARKARYNAMKIAMAEEDEEKRDAAIKSAMEQTDPTTNTTTNDKEAKAQTEEEKEEHANVASIINDKRAEFITKILSANKIFNASNVDSVEKRLRKASLSKLKQEYKVIKPFIGAVKTEEQPAQAPVIPYFASMMTPESVDASQLNASSPDSAFANLSTKELLEMAN